MTIGYYLTITRTLLQKSFTVEMQYLSSEDSQKFSGVYVVSTRAKKTNVQSII